MAPLRLAVGFSAALATGLLALYAYSRITDALDSAALDRAAKLTKQREERARASRELRSRLAVGAVCIGVGTVIGAGIVLRLRADWRTSRLAAQMEIPHL